MAKGIDKPNSSNNSEQGRKQNRRVEIRHVDYQIHNVIYRNILEAVFQDNIAEAYKSLNIWLHLTPEKSKIYMLNDPRIAALQKGARWTQIENRVRKSYTKSPIAFSLDSLWAEDQKSRTLKYYIENLNTYIRPDDTSYTKLNVHFNISPDEEIKRHNDHFESLVNLIGENDWVKSSEVGKRGATANFLIIQHCQDTVILSKYLPLLKNRCMEGEAEWNYYAMMYDRLQTYKGLPQRFGTQFRTVDGKQQLFPLEDEERVNEWRNEIGLGALGE